ncbi:MAG: hypothetical protein R2712_06585 [Vicinamibacterales bacterium]
MSPSGGSSKDFVTAVQDRRAPGVGRAQGRAAQMLANDIVSRMAESAAPTQVD